MDLHNIFLYEKNVDDFILQEFREINVFEFN